MLILLLTLEGLVCALCILYQPSISTSMRTILQQRVIQDYGREGYEDLTASIDYTQYKFSCCGVLGPSDYHSSVINKWRWSALQARLEVPRTCCKLLNTGVRFHIGIEHKILCISRLIMLGCFHSQKTILLARQYPASLEGGTGLVR